MEALKDLVRAKEKVVNQYRGMNQYLTGLAICNVSAFQFEQCCLGNPKYTFPAPGTSIDPVIVLEDARRALMVRLKNAHVKD